VFFDNVEVPVGNLVGKENDGWRIALDTLSQERGNYAMRRQVEIGWGVEKTIDGLRGTSPESATNRRISTAIGESHVALRVLDAQIRRTVQRLIDEEGPHPLDSIDKLVLNDAEQVVGRALADLLGPFRLDTESQPLGLNAEQLIHDHYFSRAASIYGGTSQIQRNIVAER
ncbi:acyl-CoA dehydrogenase family protein, partial [Rhodococcus sp. IEGM 69]